MSAGDPLLIFTRKLNELGLRYMVTGSVAAILYGEPRVTHDVDIVVVLRPGSDIPGLVGAFPIDEFYCPPEEILLQEALRAQRGHFNLVHHQSGLRADMYLATRDPLHAWGLRERRQLDVDGEQIWVAPVEYVIVRKLQFYREGQSEKHLRDIEGILRVSEDLVRQETVKEWVQELGLAREWARIASPSPGV